jgi:hypothetical protein
MAAGIRHAYVISFDSTTWAAKVRVDNAVGDVTYPVAYSIAPGLMAVDASVAVLLFDEDDPGDGLIVGPYSSNTGLGDLQTELMHRIIHSL